MPWCTLTHPDSVELVLSRGAGGSQQVAVVGWLVVKWFGVVCECRLVGCVMVESRCSVLLSGVVVGGRGASWRGQPGGRRSRFGPCTRGWFDVGRLACGLFAVRSRLQLWCGSCAVVLAASWSAGLVWVPSRCCRWSYSRMFFV